MYFYFLKNAFTLTHIEAFALHAQVVIDGDVGTPCCKQQATDKDATHRDDPHFGGHKVVDVNIAHSCLEL